MSFDFHLGLEGGGALLTEDERPILLYSFASETAIHYALQVDWDGDGILDDFNEAQYMIHPYTIDRGRERLIGAPGAGFEPYRVGTARITLDNSSGRYNPYNVDSDLYGNIAPGKKMKMKAAYYNSTDNYITNDIFTGYVSDIQLSGWNETAVLICEDVFIILNNAPVDRMVGIYAVNLINSLLSDINYPYAVNTSTNYPTSDAEFAFANYAFGYALDELEDISNYKLGSIAVENDGAFVYHSLYDTNASIYSLTDDLVNKNVGLNTPWEFYRDSVRAIPQYYWYYWAPGVVNFSSSDNLILVNAGDTISLNNKYYFSDTTDSPREDRLFGGGSFSTSLDTALQMYVSNTPTGVHWFPFPAQASFLGGQRLSTTNLNTYSVEFSLEWNTETAQIDVYNYSSSDFYIHKIQSEQRSGFISEQSGNEFVYGSTDSVNYNRPFVFSNNRYLNYTNSIDADRTIIKDIFTERKTNYIDKIGNLMLNYLSTLRPFPILYIEGRPSIQLLTDLEKQITYNSELLNINQDFKICGYSHSTMGSLQSVRTTLYLYPVIPSST